MKRKYIIANRGIIMEVYPQLLSEAIRSALSGQARRKRGMAKTDRITLHLRFDDR